MHQSSPTPPRLASDRRSFEAVQDYFALADMKDCLRRHLGAALIECAVLARDFVELDPDRVMDDLRAEFDPGRAQAPIQDCFSDGFHAALNRIRDLGGEPLSAHRAELPSGVASGGVAGGDN